jgi:hypothetical protein
MGALFFFSAFVVLLQPSTAFGRSARSIGTAVARHVLVRSKWDALSTAATELGEGSSTPVDVQFLDYRCEFCRLNQDSTMAAIARVPGSRIIIRNLPRPGDPLARAAAVAAVCAGNQARFAGMHVLLLTDSSRVASGRFLELASQAGVPDLRQFQECQSSDGTAQRLTEDSVWASRLWLRATPVTITRRGRVHFGIVEVSLLLPQQSSITQAGIRR